MYRQETQNIRDAIYCGLNIKGSVNAVLGNQHIRDQIGWGLNISGTQYARTQHIKDTICQGLNISRI